MREVVIASAVRTAIGTFNGSLAPLSAVEIGSAVITEALKRAKVEPGAVDEVIMGNVLQAGLGQNPARQAAIHAGLPVETTAFTVNKVCGSGLKAVALAAQAILAGDADVIVAGGMESMSNAPYATDKARWGCRMGNVQLTDIMVHDGLWDIFNDYHMGITAENVAEKYGITREMQDELAYASQQKALKAIERRMGRKETIRWGARLIDIDILLLGDRVYESPILKIPHRHLPERAFVLTPLAQILPRWIHPLTGRTVTEMSELLAGPSPLRIGPL